MVAVLIGGGFAASWAAAVGTAERFAPFSSGPMAESEIDWTSIFGTVAAPLITSGLISALITLAVHAALWPATRRES
jgi:hypothetical protein